MGRAISAAAVGVGALTSATRSINKHDVKIIKNDRVVKIFDLYKNYYYINWKRRTFAPLKVGLIDAKSARAIHCSIQHPL